MADRGPRGLGGRPTTSRLRWKMRAAVVHDPVDRQRGSDVHVAVLEELEVVKTLDGGYRSAAGDVSLEYLTRVHLHR